MSVVIWQKSSTLWSVALSLGRMRSSSSNFPEERYRSGLDRQKEQYEREWVRMHHISTQDICKTYMCKTSTRNFKLHVPAHDSTRITKMLRERFLSNKQKRSPSFIYEVYLHCVNTYYSLMCSIRRKWFSDIIIWWSFCLLPRCAGTCRGGCKSFSVAW